MIYVFDLDGTLCRTSGRDYEQAEPFPKRIAKVNQLYDEGHTIIVDTARGSVTGRNWYLVTKDQLTAWGLKYHELHTGVKVYGDWYVDDKAVTDTEFF